MCQECVDAVKKYFPDTPEDKYGDLLMCATPFPFGHAEDVANSLRKARQARCKNWEQAISWADSVMDRSMRQRLRAEGKTNT